MNVAGADLGPPQGGAQPVQQPPLPPQQPQQLAPGVPAPPARGLPAPAPLATQPTPYQAKYLNPSTDVFQGNYANFNNEYSTANTTPQDLRTALYRNGNTGALLHILMHVQDPNGDPNDPGLVVTYHRLSRHDQRFGQALTPFDNKGLAFFGDVVNGQAPTTVHVPDTAFNSVGVGQIPTPARLTQLFAGIRKVKSLDLLLLLIWGCRTYHDTTSHRGTQPLLRTLTHSRNDT
jgi:hypothetical protein